MLYKLLFIMQFSLELCLLFNLDCCAKVCTLILLLSQLVPCPTFFALHLYLGFKTSKSSQLFYSLAESSLKRPSTAPFHCHPRHDQLYHIHFYQILIRGKEEQSPPFQGHE